MYRLDSMKTLFLISLLFTLLTFNKAQAIDINQNGYAWHAFEHAGISFGVSGLTYFVAENGFHMKPWESFLFAAVVTNMVGAVYKFTEISPNDPNWPNSFGRAMLWNNVGIVSFGLTIPLLRW